LITALDEARIAGAALDVVDPEPLPPGHPLWGRSNCLITPHTANLPQTERRYLSERIAYNLRAWAEHRPLDGVVSAEPGY
jgi:D-3-phosphoglycerate dehydrogenase